METMMETMKKKLKSRRLTFSEKGGEMLMD